MRREKQNISALVADTAQWIDDIYRQKSSAMDPSSLEEDKRRIEKAKRNAQEAKTPLEKRLSNLELTLRQLERRDRYTTVGLLSMVSSVADLLVMASRDLTPTRTQQEELKTKVKMARKDIGKYVTMRKKGFDKHLAKRLAKLFDIKGHEAMYGASGRDR